MNITIIGHASLLVELDGYHLYIDPVFFDPFETNHISCPKRRVDTTSMPKADAVFFSHDHADHADFKSIGVLNRNAEVYFPRGSSLNSSLHERGFSSLHSVGAKQSVEVGPFTLYFTPSDDEDMELGLVVTARGHSIWCQVDTVVVEETILDLLRRFELDIVFATYNPLILHARNWHQERVFPKRRYEHLLEMAVMSGATRIVPYSSGQKCADIPEYNRMEYPVTRQQFLTDLKQLAPGIEGVSANPGDVLILDEAEFQWRHGVSSFVEMVSDTSADLIFDPPGPTWPPLRTRRTPRYSPKQINDYITMVMERWFQTILQEYASDKLLDGPLRRLRDRRHTFEIVCLLEDVSVNLNEDISNLASLSWHVSSWVPKPVLITGGLFDADYTFVVSARALMDYLLQVDGKESVVPQIRCRYRQSTRANKSSGFAMDPLPPPRLFQCNGNFVDACFIWDPLQYVFIRSGLHELIEREGFNGLLKILSELHSGEEDELENTQGLV